MGHTHKRLLIHDSRFCVIAGWTARTMLPFAIQLTTDSVRIAQIINNVIKRRLTSYWKPSFHSVLNLNVFRLPSKQGIHHEGVWGSGCIDPNFLDLGTSWRWVVSFTLRSLYPMGKSPRYPLNRRLGGPQSRSGRHGEVKILDPTGTRIPAPQSSSQ
jgi:hypothetical protein